MNCCIAVREINQLRLAALPPEQKVNEYVSERRAETYGKRLVADLAGFVVFWPTIMDDRAGPGSHNNSENFRPLRILPWSTSVLNPVGPQTAFLPKRVRGQQRSRGHL
jgi:hypothetical protein